MFATLPLTLLVSSLTALLAPLSAVGAPSTGLAARSGPVNFTSPVYLINSVAYPTYGIGVASSSSASAKQPLPIVTISNAGTPQENARWAVGILSTGNYHLHVVTYNGASTNGAAFAIPPWQGIQQFNISSFGDSNDTFSIVSTTDGDAWTVAEDMGEQLTSAPFTGSATQLFNIVPYPVASIVPSA